MPKYDSRQKYQMTVKPSSAQFCPWLGGFDFCVAYIQTPPYLLHLVNKL